MRALVATLWQVEFAWRLSRRAGVRVTRRMLNAEISRLPGGQMPGSGPARRFNLVLAQSLHGAVALLERYRGVADETAVGLAREAFVATGTWLARASVRIWLGLERDPYRGVEKRGVARLARAMWGDAMAVEDRRAPGSVSLCVLSCPFHAYFRDLGRPDLTPILCAWDTAWQAEVNGSQKPIRVDILGTLAGGADRCEFRFQRRKVNAGDAIAGAAGGGAR